MSCPQRAFWKALSEEVPLPSPHDATAIAAVSRFPSFAQGKWGHSTFSPPFGTGRGAASTPKRTAVRSARAAHGGSGHACHLAKVLPRHCQIQQKKFSVLYSCQRFKAFLGRPVMKGRSGVREHPFDGWAVRLATRMCLALSFRASAASGGISPWPLPFGDPRKKRTARRE